MSVQIKETYQLYTPNNALDFYAAKVDFKKACLATEKLDASLFYIIWIQNGNAEYLIDFEHYVLNDNTLIFLTPGQILNVDSEKILKAYYLGFSQNFYCVETHHTEIACNGLLFNAPGTDPVLQIDEGEKDKMNGFLQNIFRELENSEIAQKVIILSYLRLILAESTRIKTKIVEKTNSAGKPEIELINRFNFLLEKNYHKDHTVSDYAEKLGLAPKTLSKRFYELNTTPPGTAIKNRIALEAKRLLKYSNLSVKEICFSLGFEDPAYFSRFFKKATGFSPGVYKRTG